MQGILADLQEAQATMGRLIAQLQDQGAKGFAEIAKPLFDQYPKLQGFRWQQYTDFWNDGEECTFEVHSDYIGLKTGAKWETEVYTGEETSVCDDYNLPFMQRKYTVVPNPHPEAVAVGKLLKTLGTEALKALFGDHAQIEATRRNGVKVESYEDHD